jgi:hypothetical protein
MLDRSLHKNKRSWKQESILEKVIVLSHVAFAVEFFIAFMTRQFPFVGSDYSYFIPRLIDTYLHYLINGFSIQWYTPSFGGGLPAYPNPQHIQFSVPQLLLFVFNPWSTILLSIGLFTIIGYISCYLFFKRVLVAGWKASAVGALCFSINGFYLHHMNVGHLGFLGYPLLPLILLNILDANIPIVIAAIVVSLSMAILVYGAGFIMIVIFLLSASMTVPLVYILQPSKINIKRFVVLLIIPSLLFLSLSSSKIFAVYSFMRLFPRILSDLYNVSVVQGLVGIVLQLTTTPLLNPFRVLAHQQDPYNFLRQWTGADYGLWELDTSVPSSIIITLIVGCAYAVFAFSKRKIKISLMQTASMITLVFFACLTAGFAMAKGPLYHLADQLPFMESLHVNVRYTSAFIFPLILLATALWGFLLQERLANKTADIIFVMLNLLTILSTFSYFLVSDYDSRGLDIRPSIQTYRMIKEGNRFPVEKIMDVLDANVFLNMASSMQPYEPIFGYYLEVFKPEYKVGNVMLVSEGYFNFTNPTGYVFPEANNSYPFERISVDEQDKLVNFLNRRQPDWKIPPLQDFLDKLSVSTFLLEMVVLVIYLLYQLRSFLLRQARSL